MLSYTLTRLMTERALIQRDMGVVDAYGAPATPDWQPHLTVSCRLVWDRSSGVRSANRTYVSPVRTVPMDEGMILLELGTDVTERDRITQVLSYDPQAQTWVPFVDGLMTITAVVPQEDHLELDVSRAHLGA